MLIAVICCRLQRTNLIHILLNVVWVEVSLISQYLIMRFISSIGLPEEIASQHLGGFITMQAIQLISLCTSDQINKMELVYVDQIVLIHMRC